MLTNLKLGPFQKGAVSPANFFSTPFDSKIRPGPGHSVLAPRARVSTLD